MDDTAMADAPTPDTQPAMVGIGTSEQELDEKYCPGLATPISVLEQCLHSVQVSQPPS